MRQFMMAVMALTAFGAMLATAQAESLHGGPMQNGSQCFKYSPGNAKDGRFGSWGACPQAASTSTAAARRGRAAASSPGPKSVNQADHRESAQ
jgi:hypothetical protein